MKIDVAYKFRIYPNQEQATFLNRTFGCCRFLWNRMLAERTTVYQRLKTDKEALYSYTYKTERQVKQDFPFLKEPDAKALQNVTRTLFQAFRNYFDGMKGKRPKVGYPRFKSRKTQQSYKTNNINHNIKIDFERKKLKLPKITPWICFRDDRVFDEPIKSVTVSKTKSGHYYASLLIERKIICEEKKAVPASKLVAFDMSFASFLVSEHERFSNLRFYRKSEKKLRKLQQKLSRKQKGSNNRKKARVKLARFYNKISNQRNDWQHKASSKLAREYDAVILEDLNVEAMKRFNKGFAKTITLDFSWGRFTHMLAYKMRWYGKHFVLVDRFYASSQLCSSCGCKHEVLRLSEREWTCPQCGARHDRDENAATNIKKEGKRILRVERNIAVLPSPTVGTTGRHASGDRVRPLSTWATVNEGRIQSL